MTVHSIADIEAMTQEQIEASLRSNIKLLAFDPTDSEARTTVFLLNDYAGCKWLAAAARQKQSGD